MNSSFPSLKRRVGTAAGCRRSHPAFQEAEKSRSFVVLTDRANASEFPAGQLHAFRTSRKHVALLQRDFDQAAVRGVNTILYHIFSGLHLDSLVYAARRSFSSNSDHYFLDVSGLSIMPFRLSGPLAMHGQSQSSGIKTPPPYRAEPSI